MGLERSYEPGGDEAMVDRVAGEPYPVTKAAYGLEGQLQLVGAQYPFPVGIRGNDSPSLDAFARWRTSQPFPLFDSKQTNDAQLLFWDEETYGTGATAHSATDARSRLSTAADGDGAMRQTFMRMNYQPGKSQLVLMTFLATQEANVRKRIGAFESSHTADSVPQNGIYLEITASGVSWNIAKNGEVTETAGRDDWNGDKLDGTGPSGATLDIASCRIAFLDFEWLGVGRVRVGFVINGIPVVVHSFNHESIGAVYMSTPNLPLNYSIYQSGEGSGTLDAICACVMSEGGESPTGANREHDMGVTPVVLAATATTYALLGVKLKADFSDVTVIPQLVTSVVTSQNDGLLLTLRINPTVAGTFTYSDKAISAVQAATGVATNTVTQGLVVWSAYAKSTGALAIPTDIKPRIGKAIDGTLDTLVLCAQPLNINVSVLASLNWLEQS